MKRDFLSSEHFDKPVTPAPAAKDVDYGHRPPGLDSWSAKQMELQTTALNNAGVYDKAYKAPRNPEAREVVDLNLRNLPPDANEESVKKLAKVHHVIEATTNCDNIKNECIGTGKFRCRLGENETKE